MKPTAIVLLPILIGCSTLLGVDVPEQKQMTMEAEAGGQQLEYWLYVPEATATAEEGSVPFMLFLHGSGERGSDLDKVRTHGPPKLVGKMPDLDRFVVASPQCPADQWWNPTTLKALIDEVLAAHPAIDRDRLTVTGLSMGGYATWNLLASYPDLFAAAAPICGGGDPNRLWREKNPERVVESAFDLGRLEAAKDVPIWAFHGDKDEAVPLGESQLVVDALTAAGAKHVKLTVYPGVGHDSWTQTYENPELYTWLLAQKKGAPPQD